MRVMNVVRSGRKRTATKWLSDYQTVDQITRAVIPGPAAAQSGDLYDIYTRRRIINNKKSNDLIYFNNYDSRSMMMTK